MTLSILSCETAFDAANVKTLPPHTFRETISQNRFTPYVPAPNHGNHLLRRRRAA